MGYLVKRLLKLGRVSSVFKKLADPILSTRFSKDNDRTIPSTFTGLLDYDYSLYRCSRKTEYLCLLVTSTSLDILWAHTKKFPFLLNRGLNQIKENKSFFLVLIFLSSPISEKKKTSREKYR